MRTKRKQRGFSQTRLAQIAGTSCSQVSAVEHDQGGISLRNAIAIADALETSLDHLLGRVDDPRPTSEIASELKTKTARIRDLEEGHAEPLDPDWQEHVGVDQLDTTVGADGKIRDETVTRRLKFPYQWLRKHGLRAHACQIVRMDGRCDGADDTGRIRDPRQHRGDRPPRPEHRRGPHQGPPSRQAVDPRPRRQLAPALRQPRQDRLADTALAREHNHRGRGPVGRTCPYIEEPTKTRRHRRKRQSPPTGASRSPRSWARSPRATSFPSRGRGHPQTSGDEPTSSDDPSGGTTDRNTIRKNSGPTITEERPHDRRRRCGSPRQAVGEDETVAPADPAQPDRSAASPASHRKDCADTRPGLPAPARPRQRTRPRPREHCGTDRRTPPDHQRPTRRPMTPTAARPTRRPQDCSCTRSARTHRER